MKKRRILFVTGSRGEYGYIRPILKLIEQSSELEYKILATNMHLLPEFGDSLSMFELDGFDVEYRPLMTFSGYTPQSMVKSLSALGGSVVDILDHCRPDVILLAGDRGEQLVAAVAGAHMNIPVAHIQAGELSGNIDGLARHAIARFAHIHFASNCDAQQRLIKSGEQDFRVFNVGAPQLDEFISGMVTSKDLLRHRYEIEEDYILFVQHSVTEQFNQAYSQIEISIKAINDLKIKTIAICPNSDAGCAAINSAIEDHASKMVSVYRTVPREDYAGLMKNAKCIVGNSSSGLLEAPTFLLPAVNIGRRQDGRVQGINVINCGHDINEIKRAIMLAMSSEFKQKIVGMTNPYGDGQSSKRIIDVLRSISLDEILLTKQLTY